MQIKNWYTHCMCCERFAMQKRFKHTQKKKKVMDKFEKVTKKNSEKYQMQITYTMWDYFVSPNLVQGSSNENTRKTEEKKNMNKNNFDEMTRAWACVKWLHVVSFITIYKQFVVLKTRSTSSFNNWLSSDAIYFVVPASIVVVCMQLAIGTGEWNARSFLLYWKRPIDIRPSNVSFKCSYTEPSWWLL